MSKLLKIGCLILFFHASLFAASYVLENQGQLVDKAGAFIEILSSEVYEKTGVSLYIVALEGLEGRNLQELERSFVENLRAPYVLLFFTRFEKKIDIVTSFEAEEMFDKKAVYRDYIVPLIPQKSEDLTPQSISAFLLNGFVDIADRIAVYHQVELEHSFPKQHKGLQIGIRTVMYAMLFILLFVFALVYFKENK